MNSQAFQTALLNWYKASARPLPWRATKDPYKIWLAEVMLQQTTVPTVIPYWHRFLSIFPTVTHLAKAPLEDILHLWQGLGYYRRAHLLHICAQTIVEEHHGQFPTTYEELLGLPGLGPYTAAAIATTAFNTPATVVDGNVERVITRLFRIQNPLPASKPEIRHHAATLASTQEPRLYANAIMELGSQICTPTNPKCSICPTQSFCQAFKVGDAPTYPRKSPKKKIPEITMQAWVIQTPEGELYLRKRPLGGMMPSLWEVPHTGWPEKGEKALPLPNVTLNNSTSAGNISHTFSHFKLTVEIIHSTTPNLPPENSFLLTNLPPLPTLMKKILKKALEKELTT